MTVTASHIFAIAPSAKRDYVEQIVSLWPSLAKEYGIRNVDAPHFLARCAAETSGFNRLEESLYYTTIARIRAVWPSRFKSDAAAAPFVRQPEKLANHVYGGRYGNTKPGDGWKYRGSGMKQTTFFANYAAVETATGLPVTAKPDMLRSFPAALVSAMVYWRDKKLSKIVDAGGDVVAKLTKAIQGGTGGLADRRTFTARALKAFGAGVGGLGAPIPQTALLRHGAKGGAVFDLQTKLRAKGYTVGNIDGIFGDETERAVKQLQARYGLIQDGVAGPKTLAALAMSDATDYREPEPAAKPSGLDGFLSWLISLINR
jgi:putative chitinase